MTPSELVALHEAAHATALVVFDRGIAQRDSRVTHVRMGECHVWFRRGKANWRDTVSFLSGYAAECRYRRGPAWRPMPSDLTALRTAQPTDLRLAQDAIAGAGDPAAALPFFWQCAGRLVRNRWPTIERVAHRLMERGRLSGAEVEALVRQRA